MPHRYQLLEAVPFVDFMAQAKSKDFDENLDIDYSKVSDLKTYCQELIYLSFKLSLSDIPDFLDYQCKMHRDQMSWLNKFEKLLDVNSELFSGARNDNRKNKYQICIELKRKELKKNRQTKLPVKPAKKYINAESEDRYFSIWEMQQKLEEMESFDEKELYILREKFAYSHSSIESVHPKLPSFEEECEKLIIEIQRLAQVEEKIKSKKTVEKSFETKSPIIRTYLKINQLVDIFYQLKNEIFEDGRTAFDIENSELEQFIHINFRDKDGNQISLSTIRTILSTARVEKRPKGSKRVDISKLL